MRPRPVSRRSVKPCPGGLRRYRDRSEASAMLHNLQRTSTRTKIQTGIFKCPACKGWHLKT